MHCNVRLRYFRKPDTRLVTQPWKELKLGTKESKRKRGPCGKPKEIGSSAMKFLEESILRMCRQFWNVDKEKIKFQA